MSMSWVEVPANAPRPVVGASVWRGAELRASGDWIHHLGAEAVAELESAASVILERGESLLAVTRSEFPLPTLGPSLARIQAELVTGRGVKLLKGIPVLERSREWLATLFWGIGVHLGDPVPQNGRGHLLGHVTNLGEQDDPHRRYYRTGLPIGFHTDSCDVSALMCLRQARRGGATAVVSSSAIHNEMLGRHPDLVPTLARAVHTDRRGETPPGAKPYYSIPVFNHYAGHLSVAYGDGDIYAAQRFPEAPRMSDAEREALALFEALAAELCIEVELREGDVLLLHNPAVCHARTAFEDYPEPDRKRHLLRLYLSARNGRPLPPCYAERYGEIAVGAVRGGIRLPGVSPYVPLEPE